MELKYYFDHRDYHYFLDDEDAKYDIIADECKKQGLKINIDDVIKIMDGLYCWDKVLEDENIIEWLTEKYEADARVQFLNENKIISKEDYLLDLEERG